MITAFANLKSYDWGTWIVGLIRSFIAGGAGAAAGALGPMATDSDHFNLGTGLHHTLASMGVSFLIVGIAHIFIFLQTHPMADPEPPHAS